MSLKILKVLYDSPEYPVSDVFLMEEDTQGCVSSVAMPQTLPPRGRWLSFFCIKTLNLSPPDFYFVVVGTIKGPLFNCLGVLESIPRQASVDLIKEIVSLSDFMISIL